MIPRGLADFGPVQLLPYGAYHEQGLLKIAVVLAERLQLGDHDRSWRQHRDPDTQDLVFLRRVQQGLRDRDAREPMQHIDQRWLLPGFCKVVLEIGLEEPVFGRTLNPKSGSRHAVRGHLDIGFSDHKIDIVTWLGAAMDPEGITSSERKRDAIGLQGRCRTLKSGTQRRLIGCDRRWR